jgi:type IV pilus assembly protein PilC
MTIFKYKTIDKEGKTSEKTIDVSDKFAVYKEAKDQGLTVVSVEESKGGVGLKMEINIPFLSSVSQHDKIIFARNLGSMIEAGLPMTKAIAIIEKQSKGQLKKVLADINDQISTGKTLSSALENYPKIFSTLFVSMVRSGEESGHLSVSLKNIGLQLEKTYLLNKKIKGAMMYPAVIFSLMIILGALMMIYMVPTLTATFIGLGIKLPLSTRIIIFISDLLKNNILYILISIFVLIFGFYSAFKSKTGKRFLDWSFLHFPMIKEMVKQINSARTARTLSTLLSSGVDVVLAISITKDVVSNSYYKEVLERAEKTIQKGDQISAIFTENGHLYPPFVAEMMSVGEETGKMGDMLLGVAQFYEEEVDQKTKDLSSIIEPILMIVIGLAVGAFAISMLAPTYSLVEAL